MRKVSAFPLVLAATMMVASVGDVVSTSKPMPLGKSWRQNQKAIRAQKKVNDGTAVGSVSINGLVGEHGFQLLVAFPKICSFILTAMPEVKKVCAKCSSGLQDSLNSNNIFYESSVGLCSIGKLLLSVYVSLKQIVENFEKIAALLEKVMLATKDKKADQKITLLGAANEETVKMLTNAIRNLQVDLAKAMTLNRTLLTMSSNMNYSGSQQSSVVEDKKSQKSSKKVKNLESDVAKKGSKLQNASKGLEVMVNNFEKVLREVINRYNTTANMKAQKDIAYDYESYLYDCLQGNIDNKNLVTILMSIGVCANMINALFGCIQIIASLINESTFVTSESAVKMEQLFQTLKVILQKYQINAANKNNGSLIPQGSFTSMPTMSPQNTMMLSQNNGMISQGSLTSMPTMTQQGTVMLPQNGSYYPNQQQTMMARANTMPMQQNGSYYHPNQQQGMMQSSNTMPIQQNGSYYQPNQQQGMMQQSNTMPNGYYPGALQSQVNAYGQPNMQNGQSFVPIRQNSFL